MKVTNEIFNKILNFLLYPKFEGPLLVFKILFLALGFFFLLFILWTLIFTSFLEELFLRDLKEFLSYKPYFAKIYAPKWAKIKKRLESKIEAEVKLAILEADNLLDDLLKREGYSGQTLEEKLEKLTKEILPNIEELKEAIKVKKAIVEDPSFKLDFEEASKVISIYEKALKDLQAL